MKIIITEEQKETVVDKLLNIIDRHGFDVAVSTVGSVKNLVKVIGKDNFENVLINHQFNPNEIELVTSTYDVPDTFIRFGGVDCNRILRFLNRFGPMYLLTIGDDSVLYQNQDDTEYFTTAFGFSPMERTLDRVGLSKLKINDVIKIFDDKIIEPY